MKLAVIVTGASRGIGRAVFEQLVECCVRHHMTADAPLKDLKLLVVQRSPSTQVCGEFVQKIKSYLAENRDLQVSCVPIVWDLSAPPGNEVFRELELAIGEHVLWGILHCAGILGPVGYPGNQPEELKQYFLQQRETLEVNHLSCQRLVESLLPRLLQASKQLAGLKPFAMHLSSGAALTNYVGWDAYCISKAAALAYFKQLACRFTAEELLSLSIAPGTVMTDMMRSVLAANAAQFPAVEKFMALQKDGALVEPLVPAKFISKALCATLPSYASGALWQRVHDFHGNFVDVRKIGPL